MVYVRHTLICMMLLGLVPLSVVVFQYLIK